LAAETIYSTPVGRELPSGRPGSNRRGCRGALRWLLMCLPLLLAPGVHAVEVVGLVVRPSDGVLLLSLELSDAFPEEIRSRIRSGLEVSFEYTVKLRRVRRGFMDKTVSERYVGVSVQYSNLTKMYKMTRRVDGTVIDTDVTERADRALEWMTRLVDLPLFEQRDFDGSGTYYVKIQVELLNRFRMLFVPWDLESPWTESARIRRSKRGELRLAEPEEPE
jgi:hypothetical protein